MKNILVPLGTSPDIHETLQYAVDFASDFGAKIYVVDAFSVRNAAGSLVKVEEKIAKSNAEKVKEIIAKVDKKDVEINIASYNGDIVDGLIELNKELEIDLVIIKPRSNDIQDELYLGSTSGRIIKQTNISTLIIPKGTTYKPLKNTLVAFKSGIVKRKRILEPLKEITNKFDTHIRLLLVKTPGYTKEDLQVNTELLDLSNELTISENATTYQGVLEHFQKESPDLLCVFRRKRGFFKKLWEKNTILKSEFFAPIPVLVLRVKKD